MTLCGCFCIMAPHGIGCRIALLSHNWKRYQLSMVIDWKYRMNNPSRLTLLLALIACIASGTDAQARSKACPEPILAMTYNIRLDTPIDGENAWNHRRDNLAGQILVLRPALLGMQEVLPNQRADLEAALQRYDFVGGGRDDGQLAGEASPIAIDRSQFRTLSSGTFWLSPTPDIPSIGWDAAFRRVVTWAHVERRTDGAKLLVVNTHWDHVGAVARSESGKQIARWIEANSRPRESIVLLGDFNTDAKDPAIIRMVQDAHLEPAATQGISDLAAPSQSSFNNFDPLPAPGTVIDHVFVSSELDIANSMVIAQNFNGRVASDHFPVVALINLPISTKSSRGRVDASPGKPDAGTHCK